MSDFKSNHPYIARMVVAGELEVSQDRYKEAEAYFSKDFKFYGPGGITLDSNGLANYFVSLRHAFPDLTIRREVAFGEGVYLAARTVFNGTFTNTFTQSPVGPLEPHGKTIEWEVMNIFRFDDEGLIAEDYVQTDGNAFLEKLQPSNP